MKNAAGVLALLTNALKGPGKFLHWSEDLKSSFIKGKQLLLAVPSLVPPVPQAPISLAVDASNIHIRAVLQQSPLVFFSSTSIHVPGADNPVADAQSRPCSVISTPSAS